MNEILSKVKFSHLIIILVLCLLYLGVMYYITSCAPKPKSPTTTQDDMLDEIQTGDLIFFCGETTGEKVVRWITRCQWSHVAMVLRSDSAVLLWEIDVGQHPREGPRVIKFDEKCDRYGGCKIGGWKKRKIPIDNNKLIPIITPFLDKKMDDVMIKWVFTNFSFVYNLLKNDNKMFCSEGICETLKKIGDIPEDKVCGGMSPKDFIHLPEYDEIVYFSLKK